MSVMKQKHDWEVSGTIRHSVVFRILPRQLLEAFDK
jgi:hypothetical protein